MVGEETGLLDHRMTTEGSEYKKCLFEMQRVESLKTEFVDTDFYNVCTLLVVLSESNLSSLLIDVRLFSL